MTHGRALLLYQKRNGSNVDREAEKKKELEKEQKKMGILTYLGQTVTDEGKALPFV